MTTIHHFVRSLTSRLGAALASACLVLAACGGGADAPPPAAHGAPPTITQQPASVSVTAGQPATFSVVATGSAPLAYQWQKGGVDLAGATAASYSLAATALGDNGSQFSVVVGNAFGSATSSAATLLVTMSGPVLTITAQPASVSVAPGATATFSVAASCSSGTLGIQWQRSQGGTQFASIAGATAASYAFSAAATDSGASFRAALDCSGQGTTTSSTATLGVAASSANTQYLDAVNGSDSNPCTAAAPCRTLAKAVGGAAPGSTFLLADGVYTDANGGMNLPPDTTIRAVNAGAVTLASMALNVPEGSATFDGVVVGPTSPTASYCGSIGLGQGPDGAPQTITLNGVFSNCFRWLVLDGPIQATMTPGSLPGGVYSTGFSPVAYAANESGGWLVMGEGASLLIAGGVIEGGNTGGVPSNARDDGVINLAPGHGDPTLTLDGVTIRNWARSALRVDAGRAVLKNATLLDHVGGPANTNGCAVLMAVMAAGSLTMDHSTLSNAPGDGLCIASQVSQAAMVPIVLTQSTITHVAGAALTDRSAAGNAIATVTVDGLSLVGNGEGIDWSTDAADVRLDMRNVTVSGSAATAGAAIKLTMGNGGSFKLRGSSVVDNLGDGLLLSVLSGAARVDLGTSADPGGNTFTGNATTGLHIDAFGGAVTVDAVGNTWNPSRQGADANGRYSTPPAYVPVPEIGITSGLNVTIDNAVTGLNL